MYTMDYQKKKVGPYDINTPLRQVPRAIDFHDSSSTPPDGIHRTPRYSYEHVLDGFDIRYTRDYKNARWLSSYVEGYHWKTKHQENIQQRCSILTNISGNPYMG